MRDTKLENATRFIFELFLFTTFFSISISQLFLGVSIVLFVATLYFRKREGHYHGISIPLSLKFMIGLYGWAIIPSLLNDNVKLNLIELREVWLFFPVLFIVNFYGQSSSKLLASFRFLLAGAIVVGVLGCFEFFSFVGIKSFLKHGYEHPERWRLENLTGGGAISVFLGHHLTFVGVMLLPFTYALVRGIKELPTHRLQAISSFAIAMLIAFNIFGSGGRSGLLGILVSAPLLILLNLKRHRWLVTVSSIAVLVLLVLSSGQSRQRFHDIIEQKSGSITERKVTWAAAFEMMLDKPVRGVGPENFHAEYMKRKPGAIAYGHAHNDLLQKAAVFGLPGFLFLIAMYFMVFFRYFKNKITSPRAVFFLNAGFFTTLSFFIAGQFQCYLTDDETLVHFALGLAIFEYAFYLTDSEK